MEIMFVFLFALGNCLGMRAEEYREKIVKELSFPVGTSAGVLQVSNINGFIKIQGYDGDKVLLEAEKIIVAKTQDLVDKGRKEVNLKTMPASDSLIVYLEAPFIFFRKNGEGKMAYDWQDCDYKNRQRSDYDYRFNFTIKVPLKTHIYASTVNNGNIDVMDIGGDLRIFNVNGAITLENVRGQTEVRTINGNVEADYLSSPKSNSSYYTLNGDILVKYPPELAADMRFKSFNGEAFTDFMDINPLPPIISKTTEENERGTVYHVDRLSGVRIGKGGAEYRFETFNGDILIQEKKKNK